MVDTIKACNGLFAQKTFNRLNRANKNLNVNLQRIQIWSLKVLLTLFLASNLNNAQKHQMIRKE